MTLRPTILFLTAAIVLGLTMPVSGQTNSAIQGLPMPPVIQGFQPDTNTLTASWSASSNSMAYYVWLIQWGAHKTNGYVVSPLDTSLVVSNVTDADTWLGYIASVSTNGTIGPLVNCVYPPLGIIHIQMPADTNILWSTNLTTWKPLTVAVNYWFTNLLGQTPGAPPKMFFKPNVATARSSISSIP